MRIEKEMSLTPLAEQITLGRVGSDLVFTNAGADRITVNGWLVDDGINAGLQAVEFADGSIWNADALRTRLLAGTAGADHLIGYDSGDMIRKSRRWWDGDLEPQAANNSIWRVAA